MEPLELVNLPALMRRTKGRRQICIGLIDGPVLFDHPDLAGQNIQEVPGKRQGSCSRAESVACVHGTFVAGILVARRESAAPAISPECTLLVRPIFGERGSTGKDSMPCATPKELAFAIGEIVNAGVCVLNLSAALLQSSAKGEDELEAALDFAATRGVICVVAAGNQAAVGSSAITRHPWVIPVAACDLRGRPTQETNIGNSIGRRGLSAPGEGVISLGTNGNSRTLGGTSAAAPFVTGAIALLWSEFPSASALQIRLAITRFGERRRNTIVPPLLNAHAAYQAMAMPGAN